MRQRHVVTMVLALALTWTATGYAQQSAEELYQAGLYQEEVQGDLERAIATYRSILTDHPDSRAVGAKAQLHIGLCYEMLGLNDAQQAYRRVIDDYAEHLKLDNEGIKFVCRSLLKHGHLSEFWQQQLWELDTATRIDVVVNNLRVFSESQLELLIQTFREQEQGTVLVHFTIRWELIQRKAQPVQVSISIITWMMSKHFLMV